MAKYKVEVVETSTRIVEVEADDVSDACSYEFRTKESYTWIN